MNPCYAIYYTLPPFLRLANLAAGASVMTVSRR
jgi:hypothetical protein